MCLAFCVCCGTGVWPEGSDGTDINALVRSHNRKVIALADDFCKVHLFQYPCSKPKVRANIRKERAQILQEIYSSYYNSIYTIHLKWSLLNRFPNKADMLCCSTGRLQHCIRLYAVCTTSPAHSKLTQFSDVK